MPPKVDVSSFLTQGKVLGAVVGLIMLLVAGVAGGKIAGFRVEPTECNEAGKALAACEAREVEIRAAVVELKTAVSDLRKECKP